MPISQMKTTQDEEFLEKVNAFITSVRGEASSSFDSSPTIFLDPAQESKLPVYEQPEQLTKQIDIDLVISPNESSFAHGT